MGSSHNALMLLGKDGGMKKWIGWLMLGCLMWAHEDDPKKLDRQPCYRGPGFRKALNPKTALAFPP